MTLRCLLSFLALPIALVLASCASEPSEPKEIWRSLDTSKKAPEPSARLASRAGESLDQVGSGYWIFQRKCLECHEARVPKDPKHPDWHPVMTGMSWNAGLSDKEQADVMAYLRAAAY